MRVLVTDAAAHQAAAWSASTTDFELDNTSPTIAITSPVGGETWSNTQNVTWTTTDTHPATVDIEISDDSGGAWSALASAVTDTGTYAWDTYSHPNGTAYRIRITATDGAGKVSAPSSSPADFNLDHFWVKTIGGNNWDEGLDHIVDSPGNIILAGSFRDTVDFQADFTGGPDSKTSAGFSDAYVTKLNADHSYGWTRQFTSTDNLSCFTLAVDGSGNIFVGRSFMGTVDFQVDFTGGPDSKTSAGSSDAYITRINADGTYGWTRRIGGTGIDKCDSIAVDGSGNVYMAGTFQSTVDFRADFAGGPDSRTSAGGHDMFITKMDSSGNYAWTRLFSGPSDQNYPCVDVDGSGNLYVAGRFGGAVDFQADFGGGSDVKTPTGVDLFLTRIETNGSYGWTRQIGAATVVVNPYQIKTDGLGHVCVVGEFQNGPLDFQADFGGGTDVKNNSGSYDGFILLANDDGTYGWTRVVGGTGLDVVRGVDADSSGNLFTAGVFNVTVDFQADFGGSDPMTSLGSLDGFVLNINVDGTYGWTRQTGSASDDQHRSISLGPSGTLTLSGTFAGTCDFRAPWGGGTAQKTASSYDAFLLHERP
jgi:hypothetical protein